MKKYTQHETCCDSATARRVRDTLIRACDRLWRRIVLLRADGHCEICGDPRPADRNKIIWVQAAHIISRRFWSTRWDKRNGIAVCQDCHEHKTIMDWLRAKDKRHYNWIIRQKQKQVSHRDIDLEKILRKLQRAA